MIKRIKARWFFGSIPPADRKPRIERINGEYVLITPMGRMTLSIKEVASLDADCGRHLNVYHVCFEENLKQEWLAGR